MKYLKEKRGSTRWLNSYVRRSCKHWVVRVRNVSILPSFSRMIPIKLQQLWKGISNWHNNILFSFIILFKIYNSPPSKSSPLWSFMQVRKLQSKQSFCTIDNCNSFNRWLNYRLTTAIEHFWLDRTSAMRPILLSCFFESYQIQLWECTPDRTLSRVNRTHNVDTSDPQRREGLDTTRQAVDEYRYTVDNILRSGRIELWSFP
jgi:hypothetical protein